MTGQGVCLFDTREDAERAFEENDQQNIQNRYIVLSEISYEQWDSFGQKELHPNVFLRDFRENLDCAVKLQGLPYKVTQDEILDFFSDFEITTSDVFIERIAGRTSGYALVFLSNPDEVERAIDSLNRKHIGERYVILRSAIFNN